MVDRVINNGSLSHQHHQQPFQINTFMVSQQQAVTDH
jgi:hypothetical protein